MPNEQADRPVRLCWHGTDEAAAESIQREGFEPWTYFAAHLEDALAFGGPHIFTVAFEPLDFAGWQLRAPSRVPPECIVAYEVYTIDVRLRLEDRTHLYDFEAAYAAAFPQAPDAE